MKDLFPILTGQTIDLDTIRQSTITVTILWCKKR